MLKSARIAGMPWGMGDHLWALPILKFLHTRYETIYLETPWPQMFWAFPWIKCLNPANSDSEYRHWTMFKESYESVPAYLWATEPTEYTDEVPLCQTGDYTTRLRSFYSFPDDAVVDMSFRLKPKWITTARRWMDENLGDEDGMLRVLMHIPMCIAGRTPDEADFARYCSASLFYDLFAEFGDRVQFFDAQRVVEGENYPIALLTMPIFNSLGDGAPIMWALAALAGAIVTTDNHMLPMAMALKKPTLYLAGNVPIGYLIDPRMDGSMVEVVGRYNDNPCPSLERVLMKSQGAQIDSRRSRSLVSA